MNRLLDEDDFPLAQVGNLIMSPTRIEPVLIADSVPMARQIVGFLNHQAESECTIRRDPKWFKLS